MPNESYPYPMQTEDVCYQYDEDDAAAVDHVSLNVEKGSFVAVLGHNGSGKSTLAKLMNALYLPTEGRVLVCGLDTAQDEEVWHVRRHAGMVFQNPDNQIVANVVREDVAFGLENLGVPHEDMIPRIEAALAAVRMTERASFAPHMLSGGQKQRVAVAGVLAMRPRVLILDEPTAGLDPAGRNSILQMIRDLHAAGGLTVIMVSHSMDDISTLATRLVVMSRGELVMTGTPREVFTQQEKLRSIGLGVPQAAELTHALIAEGFALPEDLYTLDEVCRAILALKKEGRAC